MPVLLRVRTIETGVAGSPWYTNMHFQADDASNPNVVTAAVGAFWTAVSDLRTNAAHWAVDGQVAILDPATGDIQGYATGTSPSGAGGNSGNLLPLQCQLRLSLTTAGVHASRRVRGSVDIPGYTVNANSALGVPTSAAMTEAVSAATSDLLAPAADTFMVIYSKSARASYPVTGVTAYGKWANLRSRRD